MWLSERCLCWVSLYHLQFPLVLWHNYFVAWCKLQKWIPGEPSSSNVHSQRTKPLPSPMPSLTWDCKARGVILFVFSEASPQYCVVKKYSVSCKGRINRTEHEWWSTEGGGIQALTGPSVKEKASHGRLLGSTVPTQHLPSGLLLLQGHHSLHSTELFPSGCISSYLRKSEWDQPRHPETSWNK